MINVPVHALTTRCPLIVIDDVPEWSLRVPFTSKERDGDTIYVTQAMDTLFKLAYSYYGDIKLWWVIWDNNIANLSGSPLYLPAGVSLRIPTKKTVEAELLHDSQ